MDYLIENAHIFSISSGEQFGLYYGLGGRFASIQSGAHKDDIAIGPRAPLGISYKINDPNLEFFGELALAFDLIPATNLDLEAGIGIRIRF